MLRYLVSESSRKYRKCTWYSCRFRSHRSLYPGTCTSHDAVLGIVVLLSDERLEISEPSAVAGSGKLETDRKPVTGRIGAAVQANPEPDGKGSGVYD